MKETLPDTFLDRADEVQVIDIPFEKLSERLKEGKVYIPTQAQRAMQSFFPAWQSCRPSRTYAYPRGPQNGYRASELYEGKSHFWSLAASNYTLDDRIASKWAANLKRDPATLQEEIEQILHENASAPWFGLASEKFVNVLEVNLELRKRYGAP